MDLEHFVRDSLLQIARAVSAAQKDALEAGATINPYTVVGNEKLHYSQLVEFDVAVSVRESAERGGDGKVEVLSVFKAGAKGVKVSENSTVSKIKFSVPILYPPPDLHSLSAPA